MSNSNGNVRPDWPLIERLSKLDTCAVSDALDQLNLRGTLITCAPRRWMHQDLATSS